MKSIKSFAAYFFVISVSILTVISILGVWDVFGDEVIWKSFKTLGLLAVVAIIAIIAGDHMGNRADTTVIAVPPSPVWSEIRQATVVILIVSISLLALLGVLSIWEIIQDKEVQYKSLSSLAILGFGSLIIVATCRNMEDKNSTQKPINHPVSYVIKKDDAGIESISKQ